MNKNIVVGQWQIQGVPKNLTSFCRSIIVAVLVEITPNFHRIYRNSSRFYI